MIVVGIQAYIFAALSAIYIGSAIEPGTKEEPHVRSCPRPSRHAVDAGKAVALALGIGLGSVGASIGIGYIFGSMISRSPASPSCAESSRGCAGLRPL